MRIMVTQIIMRLKGLFVDVGLVEMFNGAIKLSQTAFCGINAYIPVNLC